MHIFTNIAMESNQASELGQLIEAFFLKNHTQNVVQKLVTHLLLKRQN